MDGENTPQVVQVGGSGKSSLGLPKFGRQQGLVLLALLLLVIVGATVAYLIVTKPALKVGKYSYSKKEYQALIDQAKGINVNEQDARKALIKGLASKESADRLKVKYATSKDDLNEAASYEYNIADLTKLNDYQRETSVYRVVEANVRFEAQGGYRATYVSLPFSKFIYGIAPTSGPPTARDAGRDQVGNRDAIIGSRVYSYKKGEELRGAYTSKQKTAQQLVAEVLHDPSLDYGNSPNQSMTMLLTNSQSVETYRGKDMPRHIRTDIYKTVEANKNNIGKASGIAEELKTAIPAAQNIPEVARGKDMAVACYFVIVDEVVQKKDNVQSQYDKYVSELSRV